MQNYPINSLIEPDEPDTTASRVCDLLSLVSFVHSQAETAGPRTHAGCLTALHVAEDAVRWLGDQHHRANVARIAGGAP